MDLASIVNNVAARWNRLHSSRIIIRSGVNPPSALEDRNVTIVRMKVWTAVLVRQPLGQDDVEARLGRIARQNSRLRSSRAGNPLDFFWKRNFDRLWIKIGGLYRSKGDE